jgi:hypothetical protein
VNEVSNLNHTTVIEVISDRAVVVVVAFVVFAAACGSASHAGAPVTTATSKPPAALKLTEADNGGTVAVLGTGGNVTLELGSTYWNVHDSSNPSVLRLAGEPVVKPKLQGCVPGGGCGTVTARFKVAGPGTTTITATRTSCGEALRCTGNAGSYQVRVNVS